MEDLEAAWFSGLVDGEGAIWCRWPKRTNVIVEIKMSDEFTISHIQKLWPARMAPGHINGFSVKPQWRWSVDTDGARNLLNRIYPFLVTKKKAAYAAIQLCKRPIEKEHMDFWAAKLKLLNN